MVLLKDSSIWLVGRPIKIPFKIGRRIVIGNATLTRGKVAGTLNGGPRCPLKFLFSLIVILTFMSRRRATVVCRAKRRCRPRLTLMPLPLQFILPVILTVLLLNNVLTGRFVPSGATLCFRRRGQGRDCIVFRVFNFLGVLILHVQIFGPPNRAVFRSRVRLRQKLGVRIGASVVLVVTPDVVSDSSQRLILVAQFFNSVSKTGRLLT